MRAATKSTPFNSSRRARRRGFTLAEMLVVLLIMAVLATVAVQSLEPVAQQARFEATQQTLENIKAALVHVYPSGSSTVVGGYVADMGMLPDWTDTASFANGLAGGVGLPSYTGTSVGASTAYGGWRGPYLHLPAGVTSPVDGWGRPITAVIADGSLDSPSDQLVISSPGNPTGTGGPISTTIPLGMLAADRLTVQLHGVDAANQRTLLAGTGTVALCGGVDPSSTTAPYVAVVTQTASTPNYKVEFTSTPLWLLVGPRLLKVAYTAGTGETAVPSAEQIFHLNLIPGTSPSLEVLVARTTGTTTGT